jgi:hypothetical protein
MALTNGTMWSSMLLVALEVRRCQHCQRQGLQDDSTAAKSESLISFIERFSRRHRGKTLWVYLDNPPVHRSKVLKKWLAARPLVVLKPLPRYSPDIKPREQLWNYEQAELLNNTYFASNMRFGGAVQHFVRNTQPATVKSACNLSAIHALLK